MTPIKYVWVTNPGKCFVLYIWKSMLNFMDIYGYKYFGGIYGYKPRSFYIYGYLLRGCGSVLSTHVESPRHNPIKMIRSKVIRKISLWVPGDQLSVWVDNTNLINQWSAASAAPFTHYNGHTSMNSENLTAFYTWVE